MYLNNLQQDEVFVPTEMKPLRELTSMEPTDYRIYRGRTINHL